MSKINIATLTYQIDEGTNAEVEETTLFGLALEYVGDTLFGLTMRLCNNNWSYEVRWGPKDPDYGLADRSLGHVLYAFSQWCGNWGYKRRKPVIKLPVPADSKWAKDAGWPWDGSELEDDE